MEVNSETVLFSVTWFLKLAFDNLIKINFNYLGLIFNKEQDNQKIFGSIFGEKRILIGK